MYLNERYFEKRFKIDEFDAKFLFAEDEAKQVKLSIFNISGDRQDEELCSITDTTGKIYGVAIIPDEIIDGKVGNLKDLLNIYWEVKDLRPFYKTLMDKDENFRKIYFEKYYVGFVANVDPAEVTDYMTWVEKMEYYERKKKEKNKAGI